MTISQPANDNARAISRHNLHDAEIMPWEQEGEFEIEAMILSQSKGELLVKIAAGDQPIHLAITGYLPGKVTSQTWRLSCLRQSGRLELLDGEPLNI